MRIDVYLAERQLVSSRERSKALIKSGSVIVNNKVCMKPSFDVTENDKIELLDNEPTYVGRGGLKLEKAFDEFDIDVSGKICADIGASTGGFTQCMLEHGAKLVYAVDVGHGQLHKSLTDNPSVINCEGVNARNLTSDFFENTPEFISVDLSFISLNLVIKALSDCLSNNGEMAVLIKPQFEAGKAALNKKGIVKSQKDHIRVLKDVTACFVSAGLNVKKLTPSSIRGGDGNIEYLAHLNKGDKSSYLMELNISEFVRHTFEEFKD